MIRKEHIKLEMECLQIFRNRVQYQYTPRGYIDKMEIMEKQTWIVVLKSIKNVMRKKKKI